jgi:hypothetical protein
MMYLGAGKFTHCVVGRGVVIEGFDALWAHRIVGRRLLVPAERQDDLKKASHGDAPKPCLSNVTARADEVLRFKQQRTETFAEFPPDRNICEWRALQQALGAFDTVAARQNVQKIAVQIEWLERIESLRNRLPQTESSSTGTE